MGSRLQRMFRLGRAFGPIRRQMHTISFAQFGEDVLLYALFSPAPHGFYIDVGAHHPWRMSNTYKLYLRGWSGITVEPNPDFAPLFARHRPRDLHLACGIARERTELTFNKFTLPELNSFDLTQSDRMKQEVIERVPVVCLPLQDVIDQYRTDGSIDLLSVDCEGFDLDVLSSLDWARVRPTAVIVEDFEQFTRNKEGAGLSTICRFLTERTYTLVSQAVFSFIYVDLRALAGNDATSGFRMGNSQLHGLISGQIR
jgi:FkbM family methyltransferase